MKQPNTQQATFEIGIAVVLVAIAALVRLLPHAPNATPIAAIALFGGAFLPKRWGWILPIIAMLATDAVLGWYTLPIMASVYGSFILVNLLGTQLQGRVKPLSIIGTSLTGSLLFFVTTNFAVWAWTTMYSPTVSGLVACYAAALPFFRNTVAGDLGYTFALFGMYALAVQVAARIKPLTKRVS